MKHRGNLDVIEKIYHEIPAFTDIFTEDSFYIFAFWFVIGTVLIAVVLSKFVTIRPVDF